MSRPEKASARSSLGSRGRPGGLGEARALEPPLDLGPHPLVTDPCVLTKCQRLSWKGKETETRGSTQRSTAPGISESPGRTSCGLGRAVR